ncbi:MAG: hypothetical protein ABIN94_05860 [Ferruginibacter sp.]
MQQLIKCPDWVFKMFADLCFSQIKEQLLENLVYEHSNPQSFAIDGELFGYIHNRSLIIDESAGVNAKPRSFNPTNN